MKPSVIKRVASGLAFIIPLIAYLLSMPKGLTWANHGADGGDLITAAMTLGVPHPSGYPTYTLLGWLFSRLPIGTPAWRVGLLSAVAMAGAAFFVHQIIAQKTDSRIAALVGAWSFAAVPLVWGQAIIAEVYGVNLFFVGLLLWLLNRRNFFWTGVVFGLALGTHLTIIFWLPVVAYAIIRHSSFVTRNFILGFLFGTVIFLYLPIRAGQGAITWGEPNTIAGFWALVSGQIYQGYLFNVSTAAMGGRLSLLVDYFWQAGLPGLFLAGVGVYKIWQQNRSLILATTLSTAGYVFYALSYGTADSFIYILPLFLLMGVAAGMGTADILAQVLSPQGRRWTGVLMLAATLILGGAHFKTLDLRADVTAENFWMATMSEMPPDAIVFSGKDRYTFALWYARYALKYRTDVTIIDTRLTAFDWYRASLPQENLTFENASEATGRPVCKITKDETSTHWASICLP